MQKWPNADFTHINVAHFRSTPQKNAAAQRWDYFTVEAVFVAENTVQFFDHYVKEYKSQKSELDEYLQKLGADGWTLTMTSNHKGKKHQLRRYQFRRVLE